MRSALAARMERAKHQRGLPSVRQAMHHARGADNPGWSNNNRGAPACKGKSCSIQLDAPHEANAGNHVHLDARLRRLRNNLDRGCIRRT